MKLLHIVTKDSCKTDDIWYTYPQIDHTHMISCFHGDYLDILLFGIKINDKMYAWLIAHAIDIDREIKFITTAEI